MNPYDVRKKCDGKKNSACYKEKAWLETWLNLESTKKALGVNPSAKFESCNDKLSQAFYAHGDSAHNSAALLPELVNDGVRLLVYAGDADYLCNFIVCHPNL